MLAVKLHEGTIKITNLTDSSSKKNSNKWVCNPEFVDLNEFEREERAEALCGQDGVPAIECAYSDVDVDPLSPGIALGEESEKEDGYNVENGVADEDGLANCVD